MSGRRYSRLDRILSGFGNALATIGAPARAGTRPNPAHTAENVELDDRARRHAAGLMRVNHAGEVAAQALYQGHASVARDDTIANRMAHAAEEEYDHLAWCEQRITELGSKPSLLSPLWYGGAFVIGAASGVLGDKWSLGFIAETEQQVCEHLDRHLDDLPEADARSRAVVSQMRDEEAGHGADAKSAGAAELPEPVKRLMRLTSRVMTTVAYRV